MKRQFPRPHDLRPLMQFKRPALNPTRRRLDAALTIGDLRRIVKRRTPKAAFDYAAANHLKVEPWCSYVRAYFKRHPQTQALLPDGFRL